MALSSEEVFLVTNLYEIFFFSLVFLFVSAASAKTLLKLHNYVAENPQKQAHTLSSCAVKRGVGERGYYNLLASRVVFQMECIKHKAFGKRS